MRVMVIVKADKNSEHDSPSPELFADMQRFNEELAKAGVMLAGEGLHPTSKGARVKFEGKRRTVIDGPFAESKDDRRFLALEGEIDGRSYRMAQTSSLRRRHRGGSSSHL